MVENQEQIINKTKKKISKLSILSFFWATINFICLEFYISVQCSLNSNYLIFFSLFISIIVCLFVFILSTILFIIYKKKKNLAGIGFIISAFIIISFSFVIFIFSQRAGACGGSINAFIKENLSALRAAGEMYADSNGDDAYKGFCNSQDANKAFDAIIDLADRKGFKKIKINPICNDIKEEWAACSFLYTNADDSWCIDNAGNSKLLDFKCDSSWKSTNCPSILENNNK